MFRSNNKNIRTSVNFEHISHLFLMFLMLTFNKYMLEENVVPMDLRK